MLTKSLMVSVFLIAASLCKGDVIYSNGLPDQVDGLNITAYVSADDFNLTSPVTLTGAVFWSSADVDPYTAQFSGTIGWGIYSDSGGSPGTLLFAGADSAPTLADTGVKILGTDEWQLDFVLPSVSLGSGTYWLGLHEGTLGTPDDGSEIYWDTTSNQTGSVGMLNSNPNGAAWVSGTGSDLAFRLTGTSASPEPSLFPCIAVLLVAGVLMRPKRTVIKPGGLTRNKKSLE